jgi:hypothetical protein
MPPKYGHVPNTTNKYHFDPFGDDRNPANKNGDLGMIYHWDSLGLPWFNHKKDRTVNYCTTISIGFRCAILVGGGERKV